MEERMHAMQEDLQEEMTVENTEETLSGEAADAEADADEAVNTEESPVADSEETDQTEDEEVQDGPGDKTDKKFFKKKAGQKGVAIRDKPPKKANLCGLMC